MKETRITVLYFAAASTATGLTSEVVAIPNSDKDPFRLSSLGSLLAARHPRTTLAQVLEGSKWCVNEEMVDEPEEIVLRGGEEVAIICPVSGG